MGSCASAPEEVEPKKDCVDIKSYTCKIHDDESDSSISSLSLDSISDLSKIVENEQDSIPISPISPRKIEVKDKMIVVDDNLYYAHTLKPSLSFNDIASNIDSQSIIFEDDMKEYKSSKKNSVSFTASKTPTTVCSSSSLSLLSTASNNEQKDGDEEIIPDKQTFLTQILSRNGYHGFSLFNGMLSEIIKAMYKIELSAGEYLMDTNKATDNKQTDDPKFFVIQRGTFDLYQNGKKIKNFQLSSSSTFGEAHLVYHIAQIPFVSVKAVSDQCIVWALNRSDYHHISSDQFHGKFNNSITTTLNEFELISTLGVGSFATVYFVKDPNKNDTYYSLKKISKNKMITNCQQQYVLNERSVLRLIANDTNNRMSNFLCKLYATYQDKYYLYFLMEAILGGELYSLLRNNNKFSEKVARFYLANVVLAIDYLHSYNILYRDIKPENLMICNNGYLKLIDFGLCKQRNNTMTYCGSPQYVAPEIISKYWQGFEMDYWGLGILLFEMITGYTPFNTTKEVLYNNIPDISKDGYSQNILHLISGLLVKQPSQRLGTMTNQRKGIMEIYQHRFFMAENNWNWDAIKQQTFKGRIFLILRAMLI